MNFIELIEKHWVLIGALFSAIGSWGWLKYEQMQTAKDVGALKDDIEASKGHITSIMDRTGNIETAVRFIQDDLKFIKDFLLQLTKTK